MHRLVRNTLATVAITGALTAAVAPTAMAVEQVQPATTASQKQAANPSRIKTGDFNNARGILVKAGSKTAEKTHEAHGVKDVPVSHGTSLLAEARDEFRAADRNLPAKDKKSDMSIAHYDAIHKAAKTMGIDTW
ncbi:hypothetical protein [Kitasatospora sp. SUK 42]|uniref:hypothetical protein n=1 Tax=Kitasatospora sp. SUK 42 TaxID=1588882 RepID=UPI0018CA649A|nr:hypothetical protein [Kitasatospora sp. SUK 42]MBV2154120.1 hypothetical protein [Kitasatospora sp. SUK 42]